MGGGQLFHYITLMFYWFYFDFMETIDVDIVARGDLPYHE